jgi:hypothetical protein
MHGPLNNQPTRELKRVTHVCVMLSLSLFSMTISGCSLLSSRNQPVIFASGDKAPSGNLIYNVTDTEIARQLGDDPGPARIAHDRFYLVKVSVANSAADEQPIPAMALVDDAGRSYSELADGTGVPNWLGVVRKVGPAQTEQGYVAFDAPARHYRLRLTGPADDKEIAIDLPLIFVHDRMKSLEPPPEPPAELALPAK